jgi:Tol biopolymer transport system component
MLRIRHPVVDCIAILSLVLLVAGCDPPILTQGFSGQVVETSAVPVSHDLRQSSLIYLSPSSIGGLQLARTDIETGETQLLTDSSLDIVDFAVAPDNGTIVFSAWNEEGGADLWSASVDVASTSLLVRCADAACGRPIWSPDGTELVYERHGGTPKGNLPVLWRLDPETMVREPLFGDDQFVSALASWSTDGQWFSYYSPDSRASTIVNRTDGRSHTVPNELASPLLWDPGGRSFRLLVVQEVDGLSLARLVQYELDSGQIGDQGETQKIADREAVWSPTDDLLAVTRRDWREKYPSKTQIWLMRGDGAEARAVLSDPSYQYLSPVWSPDGRYLLYQRYSDNQVFIQPEVWRLDMKTGANDFVLPSAGQVVWLP